MKTVHGKNLHIRSYNLNLVIKIFEEQKQNYMLNETKKFGGNGILLKNEEVDHLPEPAHLNQDLMHAKQVL